MRMILFWVLVVPVSTQQQFMGGSGSLGRNTVHWLRGRMFQRDNNGLATNGTNREFFEQESRSDYTDPDTHAVSNQLRRQLHDAPRNHSMMIYSPECCPDKRWSDFPGHVRCNATGICCIAMCQHEPSYQPPCCTNHFQDDYVGKVRCDDHNRCCRALCQAFPVPPPYPWSWYTPAPLTDPPATMSPTSTPTPRLTMAYLPGGQSFQEETGAWPVNMDQEQHWTYTIQSNGTLREQGLFMLGNIYSMIDLVACSNNGATTTVDIQFRPNANVTVEAVEYIVDRVPINAALVVNGDMFGGCNFFPNDQDEHLNDELDKFLVIENIVAFDDHIVFSGRPTTFFDMFQELSMRIRPIPANYFIDSDADPCRNIDNEFTSADSGPDSNSGANLDMQVHSHICSSKRISATIQYSPSHLLQVGLDLDYNFSVHTYKMNVTAEHDGLIGLLQVERDLELEETSVAFPVMGIHRSFRLTMDATFKTMMQSMPSFNMSITGQTIKVVNGAVRWDLSVDLRDPASTIDVTVQHTSPIIVANVLETNSSNSSSLMFHVMEEEEAIPSYLDAFVGFEPTITAYLEQLEVVVKPNVGYFIRGTKRDNSSISYQPITSDDVEELFGICDRPHYFQASLDAGMQNVQLISKLEFLRGDQLQQDTSHPYATYAKKDKLDNDDLILEELAMICLVPAKAKAKLGYHLCDNGFSVPHGACCPDTEQRCFGECIGKDECCGDVAGDGSCVNKNKGECVLGNGSIGKHTVMCGCIDPATEVCCSDGQKHVGSCICAYHGGTFCDDQQACCPLFGQIDSGLCYNPATECCRTLRESRCLDGTCKKCCDENRCEIGGSCCADPGTKCCNGACIPVDECCGEGCCEGQCPDGSCRVDGCCSGDLCCASECACQDKICHEAFVGPHITTFDDYSYYVGGFGDYVYARSLDSAFEVQGRLEPVGVGVSVVTGVAVLPGPGSGVVEISFVDFKQSTDVRVLVSGDAVDPDSGYDNNVTTVMKLDANSFGIFNKQSGSAVFLEYGDFSGFKFRVRIPPKTTTVVGLLGKPDWDATNEWMDAFGNQLPQPIGGGYSSDAHMYGQEHWCIRDNRDSLFAYESATGYEAFGDCDKPPGSFNFTGADDSLECLCDGNYACQMDRILFGIDAALETLDFQARVFQQRGILSFAPNQIPAATPTVVVVTVDLRGEANSTLRTVSSFVLYQISVDSRENTTGALAELLDFGSGADLVEGDHVYSGVVMVDANSTVGFQALPVFDGSVSTDLALRTFAAIQVVKGVVSPEMKDCKASTNQCIKRSFFCLGGQLGCTMTNITCGSNVSSCDPFDGQCRLQDELVPCVAVIDEDSSFRTKELMWQAFRKAYPNRPFCLLVPNREIYGTVDLPGTFAQDNRTTFHYNVIRDDGDSALAQDWASFCGLNEYTAGNVDRVALFIDSTGSLKESQVSASRDKFIAQLNVSGIQVSRVYNKQENWIRPFMQSFVP